jgi:SAM-dependent methyltransferase
VSLALVRIWRTPALQALLLQLAAFLPTLSCVAVLSRSGVPLNYFGVTLIQGAIAAGLARWRGLAFWWSVIAFAFPAALYGALALDVPRAFYLGAFLFLLLLYWSTFRTQVPYYPSGRRVWDEVARLLPEGPVHVIDIGSGLGGFALDLAARRPDATVIGIELAPLPWLVSALRARLGGSRARFVRGDYELLDFGAYDAVFAYLSPAAMSALWNKASAEMRPGSILLSYEFLIKEKVPDLSILPTGPGPTLYVWHF